jgi:hypothetical protein
MKSHPPLTGGSDFDFRRVREIESTDKSLFSTDIETATGSIPVLTGASFNLWNPDFGDPYAVGSPSIIDHVLAKILKSSKNPKSPFFGLGISKSSDLPISAPRMMVRDVCRGTDTRTAIVCLVPGGVTGIEKAPYLLRRRGDERDEAFVLGVMSSIPFDWFARRIVELSMNLEILSSMPIPRPQGLDPRRSRVIEIAGRLAARDDRYSEWASIVGVPTGSIKTSEVQLAMEAELDALVAHLYGLSRDQVGHVFKTFHRGWDYKPRLAAVLEYLGKIEDPS